MGLGQDVRDLMHKSGRATLVDYRLAWARTYSKKYGLVDNSETGVWFLTADGAKRHTVTRGR